MNDWRWYPYKLFIDVFTSYLKNGLPLNEKNDIVYLSGASTMIKIKDILESVI